MEIGITQCAMWNSTPEAFLAAAAEAGYEAVELMIRPADASGDDLTTASPPERIAAVKRRAGELGLRLFSVAMLHLTQTPLDRGEARAKAVEEIHAGLRLARDLGAGAALLTLGRLRPDLFYEEAYANGVASLRESAEHAEALGVDLAVEFVWNGFLFSPLEMKRFLDEVGSPRVGFYFDPGNMAVFHFPQHWVRALGRRTKLVHLKDWKGGPLDGKWTGLLEGQVDFPAVMRELRAIGYDGPLTSEVEPSLAPLAASAAAARKIREM